MKSVSSTPSSSKAGLSRSMHMKVDWHNVWNAALILLAFWFAGHLLIGAGVLK